VSNALFKLVARDSLDLALIELGSETRAVISKWLEFNNTVRPSNSLMDKIPGQFYHNNLQKAA